MTLDKSTVSRVGTLARIRLDEAELEPLAGELNQILDWIEQLNEVDTEGVEPMTSVVPTALPRRADEVTDGAKADEILANAPDPQGGYFAVPKVIE
ncbi:MAG: Asp-tRNA(Asn)/Glu-tRNA(Gln) amidotransferase subunit GatC [Rhodospirillales bacterium]|jgi:aspartyl-tRNA(Asn)/glutamyl-tRNA(Gln) amidotransferase subunit C|nr:Asp-tRNA(Asn)/Glu-tRNA(Gln) amidotransferase subunit GatC [Rhodospirillales bacterium]